MQKSRHNQETAFANPGCPAIQPERLRMILRAASPRWRRQARGPPVGTGGNNASGGPIWARRGRTWRDGGGLLRRSRRVPPPPLIRVPDSFRYGGNPPQVAPRWPTLRRRCPPWPMSPPDASVPAAQAGGNGITLITKRSLRFILVWLWKPALRQPNATTWPNTCINSFQPRRLRDAAEWQRSGPAWGCRDRPWLVRADATALTRRR